jgi:acylphosphatase
MVDEQKAALVRIKGRVQGVSFRAWTYREAELLCLKGWVRNEDDGSVTAMISGPGEAISIMLDRFWKGPSGAFVSSVETTFTSPPELPSGFQITR